MSVIQYDFAALDTLTGDLNRNFARLEQLSGQLRTQVNALASQWQSVQGAQAYGEAQQHWDRVFDESWSGQHEALFHGGGQRPQQDCGG